MSLPFITVVVGFFFVVISQFGARLAARHSMGWFLASGFVLVATIRPDWLSPVARLMGISLVSNMVLAGLTMFLFVQMLAHYAESTRVQRQLGQVVSSLAAQTFPDAPAELEEERPRVLVVLPCYNESESLPVLLPRLSALAGATPDWALDFCIVNDGSVDGTASVLRRLAPRNHVTHHTNIGVSGALRTGFLVAQRMGATYVVQCDSDGQHPIESIPALLRAARERGTDLLIGSRFCGAAGGGDVLASTTSLRWMGGRVVSGLLGMFGRRARVADPTSGFRVYSTRAVGTLLRLMPDEYPEPESIALVAVAGLQIGEVAVEMRPRATGTSSLTGLKSFQFMTKVASALLGLRLRSLLRRDAPARAPLAGDAAGIASPVVSLSTRESASLPSAERGRLGG
ncbi:DUF2304 family protein [Corallococcus macrosporus]|uniref:Group 2 family glycosyl transferase n=1 Tax=Myxococcus fulvus (strain ATCC BAA-855 / HW-1) TaxID=483219 RepID=F8CS10_MYXFH|nr:DUF2304 family protein [Corallococcus macrosporus]AEI68088.1 group 2 family glycosyl transferase [Corallococcus macrosporus]